MKFKVALQYRLEYQLSAMLIFYGYYALFGLAFPIVALMLSSRIGQRTPQTDLFMPLLIFMFILTLIGVKHDFAFFIQNGMSRKHIFLVNLISNGIMSFLLALSGLVIQMIFSGTFIKKITVTLFLSDYYCRDHIIMSLLLNFFCLEFVALLGMLIGVFFDRVHGKRRLISLLLLFLIPLMVVAIIKSASWSVQHALLQFGLAVLGLTATSGPQPLWLMSTLVILSLCILIPNYLLNRRREINFSAQ